MPLMGAQGFSNSMPSNDWGLALTTTPLVLAVQIAGKTWYSDGRAYGCGIQVTAASANDVWFTENGETPSGTAGFEMLKGSGIWLFANAKNVRLASKAGTATVNIAYYNG